jgi:hypothetical protein
MCIYTQCKYQWTILLLCIIVCYYMLSHQMVGSFDGSLRGKSSGMKSQGASSCQYTWFLYDFEWVSMTPSHCQCLIAHFLYILLQIRYCKYIVYSKIWFQFLPSLTNMTNPDQPVFGYTNPIALLVPKMFFAPPFPSIMFTVHHLL